MPIHTSVHSRCACTGPPSIRPRSVAIRCVSGLTSVNVCSHAGIVSTGTNVLVPNVSGNMTRNAIPWTAPGVRAVMPHEHRGPAQAEGEGDRDQAGGEHLERARGGAEAEHVAESERHGAQQ